LPVKAINTKARIIQQAKTLFNQSGFGAVNMYELAKSLNMSRGNMTYHFKNKELLLTEIANELWLKMDDLSKANPIPTFKHLLEDAKCYSTIQKEYTFIFSDSQVLHHPVIANKMKVFTEKTIKAIEAVIAFSIQMKNMKAEKIAGTYKNLALSTWMLMFYWNAQKNLRNKRTGNGGIPVIWTLLLPHLTPKGLTAFKKHFGKDYLNQLGEPFCEVVEEVLVF